MQAAWTLARRPVGRSVREDDLALAACAERPPGPGEVQVRLRYLTFAPALKLQMENAAPYAAPLAIGDVMRSSGVGEVLASDDPAFAPGDLACGTLDWAEVSTRPTVGRGFGRLIRLDPATPPPVSLALLQSGGLTAYFGLTRIGLAKAGEVVVVSGAGGAVGSTVGQIAKVLGCRVVGIAGGPEKCAWVRSLGFDAVVDYRAGGLAEALKAECPDGIDVFFDNVGGEALNAAIDNIARHGRIVICGAVSQYDAAGQSGVARDHMKLVFRSARMEGFLVTDFEAEFDAGRAQLLAWRDEGRLTPQYDVMEGFANAPAALVRMLSGGNLGRQMLHIPGA